MAVLTDPDREAVWADYMRALSQRREHIDLSKSDLREAINAVDQWIEDNKASYNTAIPQPARNNLTVAQKAELLSYLALKRFVLGV